MKGMTQIPFEQAKPDVSWYRHKSWPPGQLKKFRHGHTMAQTIEGFEFFNDDGVAYKRVGDIPAGVPTVPCELCGQPTDCLATKRCDRCWELEKRILRNPEIAAKILANIQPQQWYHGPCAT